LRSEIPLFEGAFELGVAAHAMDHRRTLTGETGGFARLDLNLATREFGRGFTLSLGVANVFDRAYADPVGSELVQDALLQDGRTWRLALAWRR
jgi:iron complex outermembrane receptor protein